MREADMSDEDIEDAQEMGDDQLTKLESSVDEIEARMIAIAGDNVDDEELQSPRRYEARDIIVAALALGIISTIFDFVFFALFNRISPAVLQTNWFIASILTELVLVFSIRTKSFFLNTARPSNSIIFLSIAIIFITIALPFTAFGQTVFKFVPPRPEHLALIFGIVVLYFVFTEVAKLLYYRQRKIK
jgi:Mg2+-importing ATPase